MSGYDRCLLIACSGAIVSSNGDWLGTVMLIGGLIGMVYYGSRWYEQRDTDDA